MPSYQYVCAQCGDVSEAEFSIGTAVRQTRCTCGSVMRLRIGHGVQIAPSALEHKGGRVRQMNARDGRWDKDMPAYKRLRHKGMQPAQIDGSAALEDTVHDQFDVKYQRLYRDGVTRERVQEGAEQAQEIMENANMPWPGEAV